MRLDILKIDCEGCEYNSFKSWLAKADSNFLPRQILIEIHKGTCPDPNEPRKPRKTEFKDYCRSQHETKFITPAAEELLQLFYTRGYAAYNKEINEHPGARGTCVEYSFLWVGPEFCAAS